MSPFKVECPCCYAVAEGLLLRSAAWRTLVGCAKGGNRKVSFGSEPDLCESRWRKGGPGPLRAGSIGVDPVRSGAPAAMTNLRSRMLRPNGVARRLAPDQSPVGERRASSSRQIFWFPPYARQNPAYMDLRADRKARRQSCIGRRHGPWWTVPSIRSTCIPPRGPFPAKTHARELLPAKYQPSEKICVRVPCCFGWSDRS